MRPAPPRWPDRLDSASSFSVWCLASAVGAFADGDVIPVLFFSLLFAFALLAMGPKGRPAVDAIHFVSQVLFKMIGFVMYVAPIGAFGAIAFTVGKFGPSSLLALGRLVAEFYVCCALFVVLVLSPIAWGFGVNILRLIRYISAELMIVVGTSSSESVFPRVQRQTASTRCRRAGCRARVAGWLRVQP